MFNSSICKHYLRRGNKKGSICGNRSGKRDSLCHKHRYRFLKYISNIYKSFKYLFLTSPILIKDKKIINKMINNEDINIKKGKKRISKKQLSIEKEKLEKNLEVEMENKYKDTLRKEECNHIYIDKLETLTNILINDYPKNIKIVFNLINRYVYKDLPFRNGTKEFCDYSNYYLRRIKRVYFYNI